MEGAQMAGVWDSSAEQNIQKRGKVRRLGCLRIKCWAEYLDDRKSNRNMETITQ
jgi:hypothetical protein